MLPIPASYPCTIAPRTRVPLPLLAPPPLQWSPGSEQVGPSCEETILPKLLQRGHIQTVHDKLNEIDSVLSAAESRLEWQLDSDPQLSMFLFTRTSCTSEI
jgi:hypothetical protein